MSTGYHYVKFIGYNLNDSENQMSYVQIYRFFISISNLTCLVTIVCYLSPTDRKLNKISYCNNVVTLH
jgi:hypothetical protein